MIREKRILNDNIVQVTLEDERWYTADNIVYYPSVSWISGQFPKGIQFYKWLANNGWNEAENIKNKAGSRGTNVHKACSLLIEGANLSHTDYAVDEWIAINSFRLWCEEVKPQFLFSEITLIDEKIGVGGTLDIVCIIDDKYWVIDLKTSQSIWKEYELQISAYAKLAGSVFLLKDKELHRGILQIGYNMNKKKYKFTEIEDKFDLFIHARAIWEEEHGNEKPRQLTLPTTISF